MICAVVNYAKFLAQSVGRCEPSCMAAVILMELGIPVNMDGFIYARDTILARYYDPLLTLSEAYHLVSGRYAEKPSEEQMDTSIRNAVRAAWEHRDYEVWKRYFPRLLRDKERKTQNTELVAGIVLFMRLWYDCAVAYERDREEAGYGKE